MVNTVIVSIIAALLHITRDDAVRVVKQMKADNFAFEKHSTASSAFKKAANKALVTINQR